MTSRSIGGCALSQFCAWHRAETELLWPQVWHATWRGSEVAAKAISLEHLPAEYREVALRGVELNVLGSLHHPHITHIYRVYCVVGESKDLPGHSNAASPDDILTDFYSLKHTKQVWIVMVRFNALLVTTLRVAMLRAAAISCADNLRYFDLRL